MLQTPIVRIPVVYMYSYAQCTSSSCNFRVSFSFHAAAEFLRIKPVICCCDPVVVSLLCINLFVHRRKCGSHSAKLLYESICESHKSLHVRFRGNDRYGISKPPHFGFVDVFSPFSDAILNQSINDAYKVYLLCGRFA